MSNLLYRTVMAFPEAGICVEYVEEQVSSVRLYGCALVWSAEKRSDDALLIAHHYLSCGACNVLAAHPDEAFGRFKAVESDKTIYGVEVLDSHENTCSGFER